MFISGTDYLAMVYCDSLFGSISGATNLEFCVDGGGVFPVLSLVWIK